MLENVMLEQKIWAVVGANNNPNKYGNIIYKKLKSRGYEVYPINPKYEKVDGESLLSGFEIPSSKTRCN